MSASKKMGGAEKSLFLLVNHLDPSHFSPLVMCPVDSKLRESLDPLIRTVDFPFRPVQKNLLVILRYVFATLFLLPGLIRWIKKADIDLIHCNSVQARLGFLIPGLLTGIPIVWHLRDVRYPKKLAQLLGHYSTLLIANSVYTKSCFPKPTSQIHTVYNPIDFSFWNQTLNGPCDQLLLLPSDEMLFAHIGQLIPWKNQLLFIEIGEKLLARNNHRFFVLIAPFAEIPDVKYQTLVQQRIQQSPFKHRFLLLQQLDDLRHLFSRSPIILHLVADEPFGRVPLEAMSAGCITFAFDSGGPAELIEHQKTGFLLENDTAERLVIAIEQALSNPTKLETIKRAAKASIEHRFSVEAHVQQMEHIFNTTITS